MIVGLLRWVLTIALLLLGVLPETGWATVLFLLALTFHAEVVLWIVKRDTNSLP